MIIAKGHTQPLIHALLGVLLQPPRYGVTDSLEVAMYSVI
jgi:hypothetical protein